MLDRIEARIAALQEMEQAFARTQAELAEQSDELARREAQLLEHGRALSGVGAGSGAMSRAELDELDERIRRLEQQTREARPTRASATGCALSSAAASTGSLPADGGLRAYT